MQLNQTHDRANRLSFKGALQHKVEAALTAPAPETESAQQILLLPANFQELSETDLHFTLMQNKELKHSRETANMATEIVFGKRLHPKTVQFRTVELANPAALPQFEKKQSRRSPAKKILADDSTTIRMQAEKDKEAEFKSYIDTVSTRTKTEPVTQATTLRVPKNYNDFSESELFHVLTHTTELEHSRQTAYLAMDILSGKVEKPSTVTLQSVVLPNVAPAIPVPVKAKEVIPSHVINAERDKRDQFKAQLAGKANVVSKIEPSSYQPVTVLRIPSHHKELSQAGLFYTLTHNPELQHTPETANLAIAFLYGVSSKPEWVEFQVVEITAPSAEAQLVKAKALDPLEGFLPEREQAKYEAYLARQAETPVPVVVSEKELVLRVPANYKEISNAELLATITQNLDYGHTHYTAYLTLDILSGRVKKPANVKLVSVKFADKAVTASAPVKTEAAQLPDIIVERERFKREAFKAYLADKAARKNIVEEPDTTKVILRVPSNYAELNSTELLYVLMNNVELAHTRESAYTTVDILFRAMAKPANVTLQAVKLEAPKPAPAVQLSEKKITTSVHPELKASDNPKRQLFKEELADRARTAFNAKPVIEEAKALKVILLPEGYESMTPGELHFALVRNPELGHSQESARYAVDILEGKIKNAPVQFSVVILDNPELAPVTAPKAIQPKAFNTEKKSSIIINRPSLLSRAQVPVTDSPEEGQRVLNIPHNYEEMSETQLHFALSHNKEYGHSYESTYETLDILYGRTPCPTSTVFATVEVDKPVERAY